ncbi:MAG: helix-turn-helix transcriptional regulator [Anaerostipes sp.]|nr:helix-turn-helix transcriptional regulator [Anaerostipes sp.]
MYTKREALIKKRGNLTQEAVAKELDTTQKNLSKIEKGLGNPSIKLLAKMCMFYKSKPEELFPDIFLDSNTT